jgi:hypothetical protein
LGLCADETARALQILAATSGTTKSSHVQYESEHHLCLHSDQKRTLQPWVGVRGREPRKNRAGAVRKSAIRSFELSRLRLTGRSGQQASRRVAPV